MADQLPHPTIVMTPPAQPGASSKLHPRRPPAHRSVSLLHSPRQKPSPPKDQSDSSSDSAIGSNQKVNGSKDDSDSPSSLQPLGRDSSGESSNAEKWFEKSNNELRDTSASFADNDPPFFMRNSSSSETPPEAQQQMRQFAGINEGSNSLPLRTGLLHLGTDGSSTEDFRSVIDDLTIENQKLKRRLKKYEKLHDSHLRDEKLFEVRIHGLPPNKKRELEETLRKFASGLGNNGFPRNGYEGLLPALNAHKTASSQTSLQNPDSAYASMSASGQGSSAAQSGGESRHKQPAVNTASRRQNIHSYLHHIPEGLLPQPNPANMTERAKKKLVVRRLEQIFAGKGATLGAHQHPLQQQEVSQMAARADRAASEAQGQRSRREGSREAHIMSNKADEAAEAAEGQKQDGSNTSPDEESSNSQQGMTTIPRQSTVSHGNQGNGEQRPTRPLDLDPDRAQVPAENIRYMRHLGFSPPDPETAKSPEEGHGWVYLNLLINMAQLHTINVTAEFVRKALAELSSKFELSSDGRKVRWKGGKSVTRTSSTAGGSSNERTNVDTPDRASPRKRPKLSHQDSHRSGHSHAQAGASKHSRGQTENSKLMYTPLFFHKDSSDGMDDSSEEDDSGSSPYPTHAAGDSSGMASSNIRTSSTKRKNKQDDGPIIFYNNARFCTDLSGDRKASGNINAPPYAQASSMPVGGPPKPVETGPYEKRGPLAEAAELPDPMDIGDNPIPDSMELSFPPRSPLTSQNKRKATPMEMEVTGIGGVWPSDNFAIAVESRHARLDQNSAPSVDNEVTNKRLPERIAQILKAGPDSRVRSAMHKRQIVRTDTKQLPPSELPPALGFPFGEDSTGDDESDVDEEMSVSPMSPHGLPPSAAPQPVGLHYSSTDDGEEEDDEDDDDDDSDDDGSLDLLAAARQVDPEAIREQEREYDANMAERLAEEIPAGSSAATAGGGSGFASPESTMNREEYQRAVKESRARPVELKKRKTSDSMKVQNPARSTNEDSDEEMEE